MRYQIHPRHCIRLSTSATRFAKTQLDNKKAASIWIHQTLAADQVSRFRFGLIAKRVSSTAERIVHCAACISSATKGVGTSIAAAEWIGFSAWAAEWIRVTACSRRGSGGCRVIGKGIGHCTFKCVIGGDFRLANGHVVCEWVFRCARCRWGRDCCRRCGCRWW